MERCPGCRARLGEDPACSRCGCDLTLVQRAETQADQFLHRALRAWAEGNPHQARACAEASVTLACSPLGQALLKCATGPSLSVQEIEREARALSVEDRARLIASLIASLDGAEEGDIEAAWEREVLARSEAFHRGEVQAIPAAEAIERARRSVR